MLKPAQVCTDDGFTKLPVVEESRSRTNRASDTLLDYLEAFTNFWRAQPNKIAQLPAKVAQIQIKQAKFILSWGRGESVQAQGVGDYSPLIWCMEKANGQTTITTRQPLEFKSWNCDAAWIES